MSTQAVTASAFAPSGGRSFALAAATDGQFGNYVLSTVGAAQIGFAMTNELITHIQVTFEAGNCAWRLRNSVSQITKRVGFGFEAGATGPSPFSGSTPPITIQQDDVLEIYPMAVA